MHGFGALFGAIIGFLAAWGPQFFDMLNQRFQHNRDLETTKQELEAAKAGFALAQAQSQTIVDQQAEIDRLKQEAADSDETRGLPLLTFLRSSVRPILTYSFFLLFAIVK